MIQDPGMGHERVHPRHVEGMVIVALWIELAVPPLPPVKVFLSSDHGVQAFKNPGRLLRRQDPLRSMDPVRAEALDGIV